MEDRYNAPMHMEKLDKSINPSVIGHRILRALGMPRVSRTINVIAIVLFAASLAHWTWGWVAPPRTNETLALTQPAAFASPRLSTLVDSHLFGTSARIARLAVIPVSHLALTLSGLVIGDPSVALIGGPDNPVRPYSVGEQVAPGVVVASVAADRVILRQNGRLQSLLLYPPKRAGSATAARPIPAVANEPAPATSASAPSAHPAVAVSVSPAVLTHLSQAAPTEIANWLKPGPAGGLVVKGGPNNAFKALHLSAGDTIEQINGRPVNNLGEAMAAYAAASKSGHISLDVAHKGQIEVLHYALP